MSYEGGIDRDDEWGGIDGDSNSIYGDEQKNCPAVDIRMLVEPLNQAESAIKCTE